MPGDAVVEQPAADVGADLDAELAHRLVVVGQCFQLRCAAASGSLAPHSDVKRLICSVFRNGRMPGMIGTLHAALVAQVVLEFEEVVGSRRRAG